MKALCILFLSFMAFSTTSSAQIIEVESWAQVAATISCQESVDLIITDIDHTLILPQPPAFQMPNIKKHRSAILPLKERWNPGDKELVIQYMVLHSDPLLLDPEIPHYLNSFQSKGIAVIAQTNSVTGPIADIEFPMKRRYQQMKEVGLCFDSLGQSELLTFNALPSFRNSHPQFYRGILCCNGTNANKGGVFVHFLKQTGASFKHVVMVEDVRENLEAMEQSLQDQGISFTGVHLTAIDRYCSPPVTDEEVFTAFERLTKKIQSE